jgi:hypothetical protein
MFVGQPKLTDSGFCGFPLQKIAVNELLGFSVVGLLPSSLFTA